MWYFIDEIKIVNYTYLKRTWMIKADRILLKIKNNFRGWMIDSQHKFT